MNARKGNQYSYQNAWIADKRDRLNLTLPKGTKEKIRAHAEKMGESVTAFVNRAIDEAIKKDCE